VLGVAAELVVYDVSAVGSWAPDLAVGWGTVALGLVLWGLTPHTRCGPYLAAAGFAWFIGNFAVADVPVVPWLAEHGVFVHRALLAQAVLAFPSGRLGTVQRLATAAVYVTAVWPPLLTSETAWILVAVAVLLAGVEARGWRTAPGATAFALTIGGAAAWRLYLQPVDRNAVRLFYEAGLLLTGAVLVALAAWRPSASTIADRVVEIGETTTVRDALRRLLDDPTLELALLRDDDRIDERGRLLPPPTAAQSVTPLGPSQDALIVHDSNVSLDGAVGVAVSQATRLTTENARLQAGIVEHLAELQASRRRLVLARGRQRALLARELRDRVEWRLARIEARLADAEPVDGEVAASVALARRQVVESRETIAALGVGLQPPVLAAEGLAGALRALIERAPLRVSLAVDPRRLDAAVEHAAYLVCSEALANAAKHADATRAEMSAAVRGGRLSLEIRDDGRGGADPRGGGLRGLAERVDELGGRLLVASPPGGGTRISAEIPLRTERDTGYTVQARLPAAVEAIS
jgi:signal transduction histidine kinase